MVEKTDECMIYPNAPELTQSEAFEPAEDALLRTVTRRTLLGGVAAAGSGVALDQTVTQSRWRQDETTLKVFEANGVSNGVATFVVPGLGVQSGEGIMRALMPAFRTGQYAGFIRFSDDGLEVEQIPELINRAQHKLGFSGIILYLHSMAGAMAPDIVQGFDDNVNIRRIDYNCSPWTSNFVYDKGLVDMISSLPVQGSYASKLVVQLADRFGRSQYDHMSAREKLQMAWKITNDQGSPKTWVQQIRYLSECDLSQYDSMPESTESTFLSPQNLSTDRVVILSDAIETFNGVIPGQKRVVPVSSRGHANPRQYPHAYIEALATTPLAPVYDSADAVEPVSFDRRNV